MVIQKIHMGKLQQIPDSGNQIDTLFSIHLLRFSDRTTKLTSCSLSANLHCFN